MSQEQQPKVLTACESKADSLERDACYMEYAVFGGDSALCASINSTNSRMFCDAIVNRDVSGCDKVNATADSRFSCYAYAGRDPSQCDRIKPRDVRETCYRTFILMNTEKENCDKFTNESFKLSCEKKFG